VNIFKNMFEALAGHEAAVVELHRVTTSPAEATLMIGQLSELAKLGYTSDDLSRIVHAAEQSEILAFEYGLVRRIGKSRTLQQMYEHGQSQAEQ
jgi:hypothetical protein